MGEFYGMKLYLNKAISKTSQCPILADASAHQQTQSGDLCPLHMDNLSRPHVVQRLSRDSAEGEAGARVPGYGGSW